MTDILERIDAALEGLCPCGARPRPGSAYCGDDCTPTWRGRDTISHLDGTAMRWSPNMPPRPVPVPQIDTQAMIAVARSAARLFADMAEALKPVLENFRALIALAETPVVEPIHPLARMTSRRTALVHGPQTPKRPPRKLDVRH
jgi:hypothetical protein